MTREKLRLHKKNMTELSAVILAFDRLQEDLEGVDVVSGKVTKSSDDFPYIEEHMTVKMSDPKRAEPIRARIRKKERRKAELEAQIQEVEAFIDSLPEGMDRQIFEMVYLDGMTQRKVGNVIRYSEGRISQIISGYLKD